MPSLIFIEPCKHGMRRCTVSDSDPLLIVFDESPMVTMKRYRSDDPREVVDTKVGVRWAIAVDRDLLEALSRPSVEASDVPRP
jgi:hypothetical protein